MTAVPSHSLALNEKCYPDGCPVKWSTCLHFLNSRLARTFKSFRAVRLTLMYDRVLRVFNFYRKKTFVLYVLSNGWRPERRRLPLSQHAPVAASPIPPPPRPLCSLSTLPHWDGLSALLTVSRVSREVATGQPTVCMSQRDCVCVCVHCCA